MKPKISIIILTKNVENTIERCINSLPTKQNIIEIIAVDGGSTDNTIKILRKHRIKIIHQKKKGKYLFGYARNLGIKHARGNIITFLSADCYAEKNWVYEIINSIRKYDCVGGVQKYPKKYFLDEILQETAKKLNPKKSVEGFSTRFSTSNYACKKEICEKIPFDEDMKADEDQDFFYRVYLSGYRFLFNPDMKVFHDTESSFKRYVNRRWRETIGEGILFKKYGIFKKEFIIRSFILLIGPLLLISSLLMNFFILFVIVSYLCFLIYGMRYFKKISFKILIYPLYFIPIRIIEAIGMLKGYLMKK